MGRCEASLERPEKEEIKKEIVYIPTIRMEFVRCREHGRMTVHQVRLRRHHGALGQIETFDRAAAWRHEAGLIGFDGFDAVRKG